MYYNHGWGGGGPVTKGAIDYNRLAADVDADIYLMGHIHQLDQNISKRLSLTGCGRVRARRIHFVRSSTYKDEYGEGGTTWHIEKGRRARPLGGWWLTLSIVQTENGKNATVLGVSIQPTDENEG